MGVFWLIRYSRRVLFPLFELFHVRTNSAEVSAPKYLSFGSPRFFSCLYNGNVIIKFKHFFGTSTYNYFSLFCPSILYLVNQKLKYTSIYVNSGSTVSDGKCTIRLLLGSNDTTIAMTMIRLSLILNLLTFLFILLFFLAIFIFEIGNDYNYDSFGPFGGY